MWYFSNPNNISFLFLVNRGCLDLYAHFNLMYGKKSLKVWIRLLSLSLSSKFRKDFHGISHSPHRAMSNSLGKSSSKISVNESRLRLGIFLLHLSKKSHLIVALLLMDSLYIWNTFFLAQRCMVPWTRWFILACSYLHERFELVDNFAPFL